MRDFLRSGVVIVLWLLCYAAVSRFLPLGYSWWHPVAVIVICGATNMLVREVSP